MKTKAFRGVIFVFLLLTAAVGVTGTVTGLRLRAQAPAAQSGARSERTAWYFYRVKWGFQQEFERLFNKNHLPVLREEMKAGRIVDVRTYVPTYHGDGRADWTFAVVITYKDVAAMTGPSNADAIAKRLYPNQEVFRREEQRRFELLDAHWDVPLNEVTPAR